MKAFSNLLSTNHPEVYSRAASIIKEGGVIAFPTDTVYGVGVSAFKENAVEKIYEIKERSKQKAIPILLADSEGLPTISPAPDQQVIQIIDQFWPGPLTLILPASPDLPGNLSATETIGIRVPDHDFTRKLLRATGPLATTSANLSGEKSALTAQEVHHALGSKIDLILDGGKAPGGIASTVLDLSRDEPIILREGPIRFEDIKPFLEKVG